MFPWNEGVGAMAGFESNSGKATSAHTSDLSVLRSLKFRSQQGHRRLGEAL
jgi:hypothetical protein